jgi:hypothetical protein
MQQPYRLSANSELTEYLARLNPTERKAALGLLDLVCEPLGPKEIERALLPFYTRAKARELRMALKFLDVVALKPSATKPTKAGFAA